MNQPIEFETIIGPMQGITETAIENRAAIERAYRAMLNGEDTALFDLLDPDCEFFEAESLPYAAQGKGAEATRAGVQKMLQTYSRFRCEIFEITAAADIVIAYLSMTVTSRNTGKVYEGPAAELFRFKDGRIIEWRPIYWDTHKVREVCGLAD